MKMKYPFNVPYGEIEENIDFFTDAIFKSLQSSFLFLPRGAGFVTYQDFQQAYEVLKRHTMGFSVLSLVTVTEALGENALVFVILRSILGFTPPELGYVAPEISGVSISQGFVRSLDRRVRVDSQMFRGLSPLAQERVTALVIAACQLIQEGVGELPDDMVHRLDKADTRSGLISLKHLAAEGVPYSMLLYERFLGRPFAGHRDAVSELVGEVMENAVEDQLRSAGISFRKTKRAERVEGFDQAPDLIIPDEWSPQIVIEAKITEDDGTARDKITRVQHLAEISRQREAQGGSTFQVIACIDGRGFGVRREDMRKLLAATQGKVFTLKTLDSLIESTLLRHFRSTPGK